MSDEEKNRIQKHIIQNVTSLADKYPETDFYYFFAPYCIAWYQGLVENGTIYRQIEAEKYIIELILEHKNIKLFSFNGVESIVTDINNYKDIPHYATWINSFILRCMHDDVYRLTKANYQEYLDSELQLFINFDYNSLNGQTDYPNDFYAAALLNEAIWGVKPVNVIEEYRNFIELSNAEILEAQNGIDEGIRCVGSLQRLPNGDNVDDYMRNTEYVGAKIRIKNIGKHNYLVFDGKKILNHGQPTVVVFDENDNKVGYVGANYGNLDKEWHQYIIDLSNVEGDIVVYFNGGYVDNTGDLNSEYIFSNIVLY